MTTDMDLTEGESYMTVTAHFITEAWGLQWLVLETKQMQKNHTTVNIAQRLGEVADAYIIPGPKRVTVVHNAANTILCADIWRRRRNGQTLNESEVLGIPYSCASMPLLNKNPSVALCLQSDTSQTLHWEKCTQP